MSKVSVFIVLAIVGAIVGGVYLSMRGNYEDTTIKSNGYVYDDGSSSQAASYKRYKQAEQVLIPGKNYSVILKTSKGEMKVDLFEKENPITVNNFVFLAKDGFYDGTKFHRIMKGFMIQGGDPLGNGTGGPGYKFNDESITRDYKRGVIAMANSGPNSNGSQFFIMHQDYDLSKNYVIFGQVVEGFETLDKIADTPVKLRGIEKSDPLEVVTLDSVEIQTN